MRCRRYEKKYNNWQLAYLFRVFELLLVDYSDIFHLKLISTIISAIQSLSVWPVGNSQNIRSNERRSNNKNTSFVLVCLSLILAYTPTRAMTPIPINQHQSKYQTTTPFNPIKKKTKKTNETLNTNKFKLFLLKSHARTY